MRLKKRVQALEKGHSEDVTVTFSWSLGDGMVETGGEVMTEEEHERRCRDQGIRLIT